MVQIKYFEPEEIFNGKKIHYNQFNLVFSTNDSCGSIQDDIGTYLSESYTTTPLINYSLNLGNVVGNTNWNNNKDKSLQLKTNLDTIETDIKSQYTTHWDGDFECGYTSTYTIKYSNDDITYAEVEDIQGIHYESFNNIKQTLKAYNYCLTHSNFTGSTPPTSSKVYTLTNQSTTSSGSHTVNWSSILPDYSSTLCTNLKWDSDTQDEVYIIYLTTGSVYRFAEVNTVTNNINFITNLSTAPLYTEYNPDPVGNFTNLDSLNRNLEYSCSKSDTRIYVAITQSIIQQGRIGTQNDFDVFFNQRIEGYTFNTSGGLIDNNYEDFYNIHRLDHERTYRSIFYSDMIVIENGRCVSLIDYQMTRSNISLTFYRGDHYLSRRAWQINEDGTITNHAFNSITINRWEQMTDFRLIDSRLHSPFIVKDGLIRQNTVWMYLREAGSSGLRTNYDGYLYAQDFDNDITTHTTTNIYNNYDAFKPPPSMTQADLKNGIFYVALCAESYNSSYTTFYSKYSILKAEIGEENDLILHYQISASGSSNIFRASVHTVNGTSQNYCSINYQQSVGGSHTHLNRIVDKDNNILFNYSGSYKTYNSVSGMLNKGNNYIDWDSNSFTNSGRPIFVLSQDIYIDDCDYIVADSGFNNYYSLQPSHKTKILYDNREFDMLEIGSGKTFKIKNYINRSTPTIDYISIYKGDYS